MLRRTLIAPLLAAALCFWGVAAHAQAQARATLWNLKLGSALEALPPVGAFRAYACGSNGGPPRLAIKGWAEFTKCRPEPSGLYEVYFEYDDELEYIARALDRVDDVRRWAGTLEQGFPVMVSALLDDRGTLRGVRMSSDARPEYRTDAFVSDTRERRDAYLLGAMLAARFDVNPRENCASKPAAEGESPVGDIFVKQACERVDEKNGRKIALSINHFRKPGQLGRNPDRPDELTQGQFESSARLEVLLLPAAGR
jgi:hypothetical protein